MKVLQINSVCGVGSTGRIATDLYKVLESQGHECVIAYGRGTAPEGIKTIKIGSKLDNYTHVAKTRLTDKHGFGSTRATKKFINQIEEYNPDVIHLHNIHGYYINIEILFDYLKRANKKVIWTLHDCWTFTGHCSHFDYVGCDKWKDGCSNCTQKKEYPSSLLVDNSKWNYNDKKRIFTCLENLTIVTPSKWLAKVVEKSFLGKYEVKIINNSIDLSVFKTTNGNQVEEKLKLNNEFVIFGAATTWDNKKGLNDFIELSKRIDNNSIIVLVGLSEQQIKVLPANIIGLKRTDSVKELVELYSRADVFVNTSVEESFGLVTVEAMACGTPVIVYNATASPELVSYNCGYIIEKNNINQLVNAVEMVKINSKKIYSKHCVNEVESKYNNSATCC